MTKEEQCEMVRAWCKATGVCPPAEGWEWTWYGRVVLSEEDMRAYVRALPSFKAKA